MHIALKTRDKVKVIDKSKLLQILEKFHESKKGDANNKEQELSAEVLK